MVEQLLMLNPGHPLAQAMKDQILREDPIMGRVEDILFQSLRMTNRERLSTLRERKVKGIQC